MSQRGSEPEYTPEQEEPSSDRRPPRPTEHDPDLYPSPAPIEDPPVSPQDPNDPPRVPEIEDPSRPGETPSDPVVT